MSLIDMADISSGSSNGSGVNPIPVTDLTKYVLFLVLLILNGMKVAKVIIS